MSKVFNYFTLLSMIIFHGITFSMEMPLSEEIKTEEIGNVDTAKLGTIGIFPLELIQLICIYSISLDGDIEDFINRLKKPEVLRLINRNFNVLSKTLLDAFIANPALSAQHEGYRDKLLKGIDLVLEYVKLPTNELRIEALLEKFADFNNVTEQQCEQYFFLLRLGGIAELRDKSIWPLWAIAIKQQKLGDPAAYKFIEYLLGDSLVRIDKHGNTSLMIALAFDQQLFAAKLLHPTEPLLGSDKLKALIDFQNELGNTALMIIAYAAKEFDDVERVVFYKGICLKDMRKNNVNYDELEIIEGEGLTCSNKIAEGNNVEKEEWLRSQLNKGFHQYGKIILLKAHGANLSIKNKKGLTALDIAKRNNCLNMLDIFNLKSIPSGYYLHHEEAEEFLKHSGSFSNF